MVERCMFVAIFSFESKVFGRLDHRGRRQKRGSESGRERG